MGCGKIRILVKILFLAPGLVVSCYVLGVVGSRAVSSWVNVESGRCCHGRVHARELSDQLGLGCIFEEEAYDMSGLPV